MTIELAYYIAQIVAAIAILGTLYYGIHQIRMNNELTRVQHINTSMTGYMDMNLKLGETPQMARVWTLGLKDDPSLSEDEKRQFSLICFAAFYGYEGQFAMRQSHMSGGLYLRGEAQMAHVLTLPGVRAWWPRARPNFRDDFVAHVDAQITSTNQDEPQA